MQGANAVTANPGHTRHSNVEPGSSDVNVKTGSLLLVFELAAGPPVMVVVGVLSISHLRTGGVGSEFPFAACQFIVNSYLPSGRLVNDLVAPDQPAS